MRNDSGGQDPRRTEFTERDSVFVQHVKSPEYRGWLIGRWRDNPYLARVAWVEPACFIDIYNTDLLRAVPYSDKVELDIPGAADRKP